MKISRIILSALCMVFLVGYKVYPGGNQWNVTIADPKIYLKFCKDMTIESNDVDSTDPLSGQTLTHALLVNSINSDFNSVTSSFIRLADSATDATYNATTHAQRVIEICNSTIGGSFSGWAEQTTSGGKVTGCKISIAKLSNNAKALIKVLSHEIGHCLGLDHPQETKWAIMSYFADSKLYRLQMDDMAGLTYLYPTDTEYKRKANMGASCAPNN